MVDWDWDRVVFDHVKVTVADAAASVAFYKTVLEPLQIPPLWESERGAQFANLVVIAATSGAARSTWASSRRRAQVDAFHAAGVRLPDNGPPGVREQYSSDEAALLRRFLLDPDGNNVEAVVREF